MALTNSRSLQIPMAESETLHNTTSPSFQFDSLNFGGGTGINAGNIGISLQGGNNNNSSNSSNNNNNSNNNNANNNPGTGTNGNTAENIDINTLSMFRRMSEAIGTLDLIPPMGQNLNDIPQFPADLSLPIPLDDTSFASGRATSNPLQVSTSASAATQKKDTATATASASTATASAAKKADNPLLEVSKLIPVTGERPLPDDKSYALDDDVLFEVFGVLWEQDQAQQGMTVKQICDHLLTKRPEMSSLSTKLSNLISAKLNAYVKKIEKGEVTLKYAISREWSNSSPRRMLYIYRGILAPDYKEHALRVTNRLKQQAELNGDSAGGNAGITADVTKNGSSNNGNGNNNNNNANGSWGDSGNHSNNAKRSSGNSKNNRSNNGNNSSKHGGNSRSKASDTSLGHSNMSTDTTFSLNMDFNVPYASSPVSVNLNSYVDPSPAPSLNNVNMIQQGTTTVGDSGVDSVANNSTKPSYTKNVKPGGKKVTNKTNGNSKPGANNNLPGTSDKVVHDTDDNQSQTRKRMTPEYSREPEPRSKGTGDGGGTNSKRRKSTQGTPDSTSNGTAEAVANGIASNTSNSADSLGDSLELNDVNGGSGASTSATYITAVAATPRISKFLPRAGFRGVGVGFGSSLGVAGSVNSNPISSSNPGLNNSGSNLVSMFHRFVSAQTPIARESESGASPDQDSADSTATGPTTPKIDSSTGSNVSGGLSKTRGSEMINQSWMKVVREGFLIQDIEPPESISSERLDDII